jgi:hypothetical protein
VFYRANDMSSAKHQNVESAFNHSLCTKVQKFVIFENSIREFVRILADNWDSLGIRLKIL